MNKVTRCERCGIKTDRLKDIGGYSICPICEYLLESRKGLKKKK